MGSLVTMHAASARRAVQQHLQDNAGAGEDESPVDPTPVRRPWSDEDAQALFEACQGQPSVDWERLSTMLGRTVKACQHKWVKLQHQSWAQAQINRVAEEQDAGDSGGTGNGGGGGDGSSTTACARRAARWPWSGDEEMTLAIYCKNEPVIVWGLVSEELGRTEKACQLKWWKMQAEGWVWEDSEDKEEEQEVCSSMGDELDHSDANDSRRGDGASHGEVADAPLQRGRPWFRRDEQRLAQACKREPWVGWQLVGAELARTPNACSKKWRRIEAECCGHSMRDGDDDAGGWQGRATVRLPTCQHRVTEIGGRPTMRGLWPS